MRVAFVGVGVMGEPMCRNLIRADIATVRVVDPSPESVERLVTDGAEPADLESAVAWAETVMLSLPGGPEVAAVARTIIDERHRGTTVVDLSTSPVELTLSLAERAGEHGLAWVDAPVARTRAAAEAGTLSIMVGGDDETVAAVRPLLEPMASDITHCGAVGTGQIAKLLNNFVLFQNVVALAEAMTIADRSGLGADRLLDVVSKGSGDSFALRNHATNAMLPDEFPERAFATDYARKDLDYALDLAQSVDVNTLGGNVAAELLAAASARGLGAQYWPALIRVIRDPDPQT